MIRTLQLKFGASSAAEPLAFTPAPLTVFVGPNNSGKSLALREVESVFHASHSIRFQKIIADLVLDVPNDEDSIFRAFEDAACAKHHDGLEFRTQQTGGERWKAFQLEEKVIRNNSKNPEWARTHLGALYTIRMDGKTRLSLVDERVTGDLQQPAAHHLQALFCDAVRRRKLREITADAFSLHFTVDPTSLGKLRIRMSPRAPQDEAEEQALDARARKFHSAAFDIKDLSDGVKAFTGLVAEVLSAKHRIILIDEPEAFLHPPLARKLGRHIAQVANERSATVLASTHSSDFLMGCIDSGVPVNIVRLTYSAGVPTARLLPSDQVRVLMRDPLLRSTGVLGGLFHESVVVTESASDRAFYDEVNQRLLAAGKPGAPSCLHLHAQNKQTVCRIIKALRSLGVAAAAIVDIDVLKEGGKNWSNLMESASIPEVTGNSLATGRTNLRPRFDASGKDMKRDGGIDVLDVADREAAQTLLDQLATYGIFVVARGELESWLKDLGITGHGSEWLVSMFERMGSDPDAPGYVTPSDGDVWEFSEAVASWLCNPRRKGMPS